MAFKKYETSGITTETQVLTNPTPNEIVVIGLSVATTSSSPATVSIKLNTTYIVKDAPIPVGGSLVVDPKIVLYLNTDAITVSSDTTVDVVVSTMEL